MTIRILRGTEIVQQSTGIIREAIGTFYANATLDQDSGCMLFTLPVVGLCYVMEGWSEVN